MAPSTTEPNSAAEPAPKQLAAGYRGEHACEGCGARFETTFPAKRFCSTECRVEVRRKQLEAQRRARGAPIRQRREKGAQATRICALEACGAEFALLPGKPHQRFCSRPCADKGRQAQQQRAPRENRKGEPEYEPEGFNESLKAEIDSLRESPAPGRWIAVEVMARLERPHRLAGWLAENVPARVLAASAELAARLEEPA